VGYRRKGREGIFDDLDGFRYIHFLLNHPGERIQVKYLINPTSPITGETKIEWEQLKKENPLATPRPDKRARDDYQSKIEAFQKQLENEKNVNPEKAMEIKQEIEEMQAELAIKAVRDPNSLEGRARVTVRNRISDAINKIYQYETIPSMKKYLDIYRKDGKSKGHNTIQTGYDCSYNPLPGDQPEWILYESELT